MRVFQSISFISFFLVLLLIVSVDAAEPSSEEQSPLCGQLSLTQPTAAAIGLLGLDWQMNRAEVERIVGAPIPEPLVVEKIEDLTAPLNVAGIEARISVNFNAEGVSDVMLHYNAGDSWGLFECIAVFRGMPLEKRIFQGSKQTVVALRMSSDAATVTFLMHLDSRQVLKIAKPVTAVPKKIAAEELDAMAPGTYLMPLWADRVMIVVRRSDATAEALQEKGVRPEERTFFQWLDSDAREFMDATRLAHPELRSERAMFGIYELTSPENGCYVSPVTEGKIVVRLHDPCTKQDFDLAGHSLSKPLALTVPPHHFDKEGNLVIGE